MESFTLSSRISSLQKFTVYIVVFMLNCFYYVFALMFITLLTVPAATLSLNRLLVSYVQYVTALTHHSQTLFISAWTIKN